MADTLTTVLAVALLFIGVPLLILWISDRRRKQRRQREHPPGSDIADERAYDARLLNPDWASAERCLQRPVPQALQTLYAARDVITRRDLRFTDDYAISAFEPLDQQALLDTTRWLGFQALAIATTQFGDSVYLRPGAAEADTVYLTHH